VGGVWGYVEDFYSILQLTTVDSLIFDFSHTFVQVYFDFIDESFVKIQALRLTADAEKKKFAVKH
jgi:hypothetical protein